MEEILGHKYAGNMIIYPAGIWYGRVKPCDVKGIIEKTIISGEIIPDLLRGSMSDSTNW